MISPRRSERVSVAASTVSRAVPVKRSGRRRASGAAGQFERDVEAAGARVDVHPRRPSGRRSRSASTCIARISRSNDDGDVLRLAEAELAGDRARDAVVDLLGGDGARQPRHDDLAQAVGVESGDVVRPQRLGDARAPAPMPVWPRSGARKIGTLGGGAGVLDQVADPHDVAR